MSFIQKQLICNKNLKMKISFSKTSSFNFSKKQFHWKVNKSSMTGISTSCLYNTPNSITKSLKSSSYMYIGTISQFSTTNDKKQENEDVDEEDPSDYDNYDDYDDGGSATTAKDRVLGWGQAIGSVLLLSLGIVGLYFVGTTLFPGRMGPNSVYADAFEIVRYNDEVIAMTGEPMKAFGKDSGNDGRRTNIEFRQFKEDDGSDRTRIRFNVKGPRGQAIVWAEVRTYWIFE